LKLTARGIPLFEDVIGPGASLDVELAFESDGRTVSPTLRYDPDWIL
jgi:hypothetical protein